MKFDIRNLNRPIHVAEFRELIKSRATYLIVLLSVLIYSFFVSSFDINLYFYASPFIISHIAASTIYIGLSVSTFTFGVIVSALIGGYAFNRVSIKILFLASISTATAASIMTGFVSAPNDLLLFRFIVGMGTGMLQGTVVGFIGMVYLEKRGFLLSFTGIAFSFGLLIGPYSEAFIAPLYVPSFILSGILGTLSFILLYIMVPNVHRNHSFIGIPRKRKIFSRNLILIFLAIFSFGIGYFGFIGYFSHYLINYMKVGHYISALTVSMLGLGGIILTLPLGRLSDLAGRKLVLMLVYAMLAATSFVIFFLHIPIIILIVMSFFFGGAYDALIIVTAEAAQDYAGSGGEGSSSGLMYSFFYGGGIIGGSFFGLLLAQFGFRFTGVIAVSIFMVIGFIASSLITENTKSSKNTNAECDSSSV